MQFDKTIPLIFSDLCYLCHTEGEQYSQSFQYFPDIQENR